MMFRKWRSPAQRPRPGLDQQAEDVALVAVIDGDDMRAVILPVRAE